MTALQVQNSVISLAEAALGCIMGLLLRLLKVASDLNQVEVDYVGMLFSTVGAFDNEVPLLIGWEG